MDEKDRKIIMLEEFLKLKEQQIIALRRSLMEARTIVLNECAISPETKETYMEWLYFEETDYGA